MKLSTSTGDFFVKGTTAEEEIAWIAKAGFKHINLEFDRGDDHSRLNGEDWEERIESMGQAMKQNRVDGVLAHSICGGCVNEMPYEKLVEEMGRAMIACDRLGIPDLVVHPMYESRLGARGNYEKNKRFYNDLFEAQPNTKVNLLIENMADTECAATGFSTGSDMAEFLEWVKLPRLYACLDTAHINLNLAPRDNQYDSVVALKGWLRALHVSDNFGKNLHWHTVPFAGNINFDSFLCGLKEIGYRGAFNFEASYFLKNAMVPPTRRKAWEHPTDKAFVPKLYEPPVELKLAADQLLYTVGKYLLEQYGCFEE